MQIPVEDIFHNSAEELKLKATFNLSNTYQRATTSCVCYTLAVPGHWEEASSQAEADLYMLIVGKGRRELTKEKPGYESSPGKRAGNSLACSMWQCWWGVKGMVSPRDYRLLSGACYYGTKVLFAGFSACERPHQNVLAAGLSLPDQQRFVLVQENWFQLPYDTGSIV